MTEPDLQDLPFVVMYALRHAFGRQSYGVSIVQKFVKLNWPLLQAQRENILKEIKEQLEGIQKGWYDLPQDIISDWQELYNYLLKQ